MGRLWKRLIYIVKDCLKKRDLDVWQAIRMVNDRSVWQGFVRGNDIEGTLRVFCPAAEW